MQFDGVLEASYVLRVARSVGAEPDEFGAEIGRGRTRAARTVRKIELARVIAILAMRELGLPSGGMAEGS